LNELGLHGIAGDAQPTGSPGLIAVCLFNSASEHLPFSRFEHTRVSIGNFTTSGSGHFGRLKTVLILKNPDNRCGAFDAKIPVIDQNAAAKPGSAQAALPGISAKVVDDQGNEVDAGGGGYLVLDKPWPSMLRGIWGDEERYKETYWSRFAEQGYYFAGDGAKYDADGDIWLLGRVDDVMNVSGHRISTAEVEHALVSHPSVAEAAVVGANDATTGQAIIAYVTLRGGHDTDTGTLRDHVGVEIGAIAKPKTIYFTPELPKTRSGKIMRRLLRDVAEGRNLGDTTTLADSSVVDEIQRRAVDTPPED